MSLLCLKQDSNGALNNVLSFTILLICKHECFAFLFVCFITNYRYHVLGAILLIHTYVFLLLVDLPDAGFIHIEFAADGCRRHPRMSWNLKHVACDAHYNLLALRHTDQNSCNTHLYNTLLLYTCQHTSAILKIANYKNNFKKQIKTTNLQRKRSISEMHVN